MESLLENIPTYLTILSAICGGVTVAILGGMVIWTFRDMRSRSRDVLAQILATLLVLVLPVVGLVVYLMLRPRETLDEAYEHSLEQEALLQAIEEPEECPGCGQRVDRSFLYCPDCHTRLKKACPECGKPLRLHWTLCAYCGATVTSQALETLPSSVEESAPEDVTPAEA
jgi:hypothetical protein